MPSQLAEFFLVRHPALLALLAGSFLPLAFEPFNIFLLILLWPAVLLVLLDRAEHPKQGFRLGFSFAFGGFLGGLYWLYISLHTFGKAPLYIAIPLMLGTVAIMALYWGIFGWLYVRVFRAWLPALRYLCAVPFLWVVLDWARGWVASGFPWLSLGYSQTDAMMGGYAPILGVFGITYLLVLMSASMVWAVRVPKRTALSGLLIVTLFTVGAWLKTLRWTEETGVVTKVSLIQGSIPQDRKWAREQFLPTLELYRDLTRESFDADLVVWPEAAIPSLYRYVTDYFESLRLEAKQTDTAILAGIPRHDDGLSYNSVVALNGETVSFYDKRHLVPFGEYFPVPKFVREWMRLRNLPYSDFEAGAHDQAPIVLADQELGVTICYEDVFGEEQIELLKRATLLVNVSNDAWFGDSIAPHQHLQIARMRAMEAERYLLRATNTGISAIIGPKGEVMQQSPQFETHVLKAEVDGLRGLTPYAQGGNGLVLGLATLVLLISWASVRPRPEV